MKRTAFAFVFLSAALALGACSGTITSVGVPADSPWNTLTTVVTSPYDDLTVVTVGSDISATIPDAEQIAVCTSDQGGFYAVCDSPGCPDPVAECVAEAVNTDLTNVGSDGQVPFVYGIEVTLDRPAFAAGGVQLQSVTAGTVGAIALTVDGGTTLNIGAGFSEGLIQGPTIDLLTGPGVPFELLDDFAALTLGPAWPDFGEGYVCTDGTTTSCDPSLSLENVAALCDNDTDVIAFRTNGATGPISVLCGAVTVNINVNSPFASAGECITSRKQQECSGLTGKAKAACNHAQIGVCQASFNIPSAHAN